MKIDELTLDDLPGISQLQPEGWSDITPTYGALIEAPYCLTAKTTQNNTITGVGCGIIFGKTAWLAMIIVDSRHRKQGIGSFIVEHLLNKMKSRGVETISLIATDEGYSVYKKFGFTVEINYLFFRNQQPVKTNKISPAIIPAPKEMEKDILELDIHISGEKRTPFLESRLEGAYVYLRENNLEGYYLPRAGEGFIGALTPEAGLELMNLKYETSNLGVIPEKNIQAAAFFEEKGFSRVRVSKRMILGKSISWHPEFFFSRIGGYIG